MNDTQEKNIADRKPPEVMPFTRKISLKELQDPEMRSKLINCYQDVFGHEGQHEWGEYIYCPLCNRKYSIEHYYNLKEYLPLSEIKSRNIIPANRFCNIDSTQELLTFHTDLQVTRIFEESLVSPLSFCNILTDKDSNIRGFILGRLIDIQYLWDNVLCQVIEENTSFTNNSLLRSKFLKSFYNINQNTQVLYIEEVGIQKNFRSGIKSSLYILVKSFLLDIVNSLYTKNPSSLSVLAWTNINSTIYSLLQCFPEFTVLLQDNKQEEGRKSVIVTIPFEKLYSQFTLPFPEFFKQSINQLKALRKDNLQEKLKSSN